MSDTLLPGNVDEIRLTVHTEKNDINIHRHKHSKGNKI